MKTRTNKVIFPILLLQIVSTHTGDAGEAVGGVARVALEAAAEQVKGNGPTIATAVVTAWGVSALTRRVLGDSTQGEKGALGAPGPHGPQGEQGPAGQRGADGKSGPQGEEGQAGPQGKRGEPGVAGADGQPGLQGEPGPAGADGVKMDEVTTHIRDNLMVEGGMIGAALKVLGDRLNKKLEDGFGRINDNLTALGGRLGEAEASIEELRNGYGARLEALESARQ